MDTLITSNDTWALWAVLLVLAATGLWLERTYVGARLSGAVFTLVLAFLLTNMGIIPSDAKVYTTVSTFLVPLAIPLLLFNADLRRIPRETGLTLVAFVAGAIGTMAGTIAAFYCVPLGDNSWRFAALFSATLIGGSQNFHALAQSVGLTSPTLAAGVAAENLLRTIYFLILFALPVFWGLRRSFHEPITERWGVTVEIVEADSRVGTSIYLPSIASALGLSALICTAGYFAEARLGWNGAAILIAAAVALVLAVLLPRRMEALKGGNEIGMLFMQIFFATIGAGANIAAVFKGGGAALFLFAGVILVVHLALLLLGGKFLGLSLPEIVIASNANVGGATTSAAMAAAKRWHHLVLPAVLCGTLGYAVATVVGTALGNFLR